MCLDLTFCFGIRPNVPSGMFFSHNTNMVPPYRVLVDTNFINFSIQNKVTHPSFDCTVIVFVDLVLISVPFVVFNRLILSRG